MKFIWSEYIRHRAESREFDLGKIEEILRYSAERYFDTETNRLVAVGRHDERLIMIPYEGIRRYDKSSHSPCCDTSAD